MANITLVTFLYLLLRDKLPTGEVELLLQNAEKGCKAGSVMFSNPFLEQYARGLAARLRGDSQ